MPKLYSIILSLIFFTLILPSNANAFYEMEKNFGNPNQIIFTEDFVSVFQTHIFNNQYKALFSTKNENTQKHSITLAESVNGFDWQIVKEIITSFDNLYAPRIVNVSNTQNYIYFTKETSSGLRTYYSKCDNEYTCETEQTLIIPPQSAWEQNGTVSAFPVKDENSLYLFYTGWGNLGFRIGLATSADGENWTKCPNNPIINDVSDGPAFFQKNGVSYLFYHSQDGIREVHSTDSLGCTMTWSDPTTVLSRGPEEYDSNHMISPSLVEKNGILYLYYSGLGPDGWTLNLATADLIASKQPIVFIPGMFASWNKDAIVYKSQVDFNNWHLNPILTEYNGILETFENLGYEQNKDFYIFAYDWRKSIVDSAQDLELFLNQNVYSEHPEESIKILGHSLGGMIARTYFQNNVDHHIEKIFTIGSPHQGTALAYKPINGGELEKRDQLSWFAFKLALQLYRTGFETDKEIIASNLPVTNDLLPISPFLINSNNQPVSIDDMFIKNYELIALNSDFSDIFPQLQTLSGTSVPTIDGYTVGERSLYDQIFGLYPDGRPTSTLETDGDGTATLASSQQGEATETIQNNHRELIYTREAIDGILNTLEIDHDDIHIVPGSSTEIFPSLFFLIQSPATLEAQLDSVVYPEKEGMILIPNAEKGTYSLRAHGLAQGNYTILVGKITETEDVWDSIQGKITATPASNQTDVYSITFDPEKLEEQAYNLDQPVLLFDELLLFLTNFNATVNNPKISATIQNITKAKTYYQQNNKGKLMSTLLTSHTLLFQGLRSSPADSKSKLLTAVEKLENLYHRSLNGYTKGTSVSAVKNQLKSYKKTVIPLQNHLLLQKQLGVNVEYNAFLLLELDKRIQKIEKEVSEKIQLASIELQTVKELFKEVRVDD